VIGASRLALGICGLALLGGCPGGGAGGASDDAGSGSAADAGMIDSGPVHDAGPITGARRLLLRGMVVDGREAYAGEVVVDRTSGTVVCAAAECPPDDGTDVIDLRGQQVLIAPGLIDPHNHMQYNTLPPWRTDPTFSSRYRWQSNSDYRERYKKGYDQLGNGTTCDRMLYAEARLLIGGTTSVQGSAGGDCMTGGVRNLEEGPNRAQHSDIRDIEVDVKAIGRIRQSRLDELRAGLLDGSVKRYAPHIGEGVDRDSREEFATLAEQGLLGPRTSVIHGTGAGVNELMQMSAAGAALIWSPRSNLALYGETTKVSIAKALGIPIAIGVDWTPSGSFSIGEEMACAESWDDAFLGDVFSAEDVVKMVTRNAALSMGLGGTIGTLEAGAAADLVLIAGNPQQPWTSIAQMAPDAVLMTMVGGRVLFGDPARLPEGLIDASCETLDVCGSPRRLCLAGDGSWSKTVGAVAADLQGQLDGFRRDDPMYDAADPSTTYQYDLAPLVRCDPAPACRPWRSGAFVEAVAGDADGDGTTDADDNCPNAYNVGQGDFDADGFGDRCDACPIEVGNQPCTSLPNTDDADADGITDADDNCGSIANPDQADADDDGKGDACDPCPQVANPGDALCPATQVTIEQVQSGEIELETELQIVGAVVTGIISGKGFFIQQGTGPRSGVLVYDEDFQDNRLVEGAVVDVRGRNIEFYEATEIVAPVGAAGIQVTFNGTADVPEPTAVNAADIETQGQFAEDYEGVLVRVSAVEIAEPYADRVEGDQCPNDPCTDHGGIRLVSGLLLDDTIYREMEEGTHFPRRAGVRFSAISGIGHFSYDNAKLLPRSSADMVVLEE
jgi:cytosine/adenosine deaminase-related metal-dependent hydrolase